jgi:hypothetical protein
VAVVTDGQLALPESSGYLSIYQRTVQPMSTGAVLVLKGSGGVFQIRR